MKHLFGALLGGVTAGAFAQRLAINPLRQGRLVIDVSPQADYQQEHLPTAYSMPLDGLAEQIVQLIPDRTTPLALYCRTGEDANQAASQLRRLGYSHVENLGAMTDAAQRLHQLL